MKKNIAKNKKNYRRTVKRNNELSLLMRELTIHKDMCETDYKKIEHTIDNDIEPIYNLYVLH